MQLHIREIDKSNPNELDVVVRRCMMAVLETIPEFEGSEELAKRSLANFSHEAMAQMIRGDFEDAAKRIMVATVDDEVVGQALYSIKTDADSRTFGFCFSRYILPEYRRNGIATALLQEALDWFKANRAEYVSAQTHVTNISLQRLFEKFGFVADGPHSGPWPYLVLRKEL